MTSKNKLSFRSLPPWLARIRQSWTQQQKNRSTKYRSRKRLFESLEGRRLLATDVFAATDGENLSIVLVGTTMVVSGDVRGELLRQDSATIDELRIIGSDKDDSLRIDFSGGNIAVPIVFEGRGQSTVGGDRLRIDAGLSQVDLVRHTFVNPSDGSIRVELASLSMTIQYTGLEPIVDNLSAVNREFIFTGGSESITLSDDVVANNNVSMIDSTLGESVVFVNPTNSLTVRSGNGIDVVNVTTLDAQYRASLILDGGASDADTVTLTNVNLINTPERGLTIREFEIATVLGGQISGNVAMIGGGLRIENSTAAATTATLTGVTITDNNATAMAVATDGGGGVYSDATTLLINGNSTISNNTTAGSGGGVFSLGQLMITNSTLAMNAANRAGGAIEIAAGSGPTTLTNVSLTNNDALSGPGNGGGLHVTGVSDVAIMGGMISDNTAAREGGGLWNDQGVMTVNGTTFLRNISRGNAADDGGGAIFNNGGELDLDDLTLTDNEASGALGSGGGLFSIAGIMTIDNSTFISNSANRAGGGIEIVAGTVTIRDTDLIDNDVDGRGVAAMAANPGNGGGLHVTMTTPGSATITIARGEIRGNIASQEGGGLWNSSGATMILDEVNINNNTARSRANANLDQGGGGVFNNGGRLVIQNDSQIVDNEAMENLGSGGGVMTLGGIVEISHTTFLNNLAARAGGAIENNAGTLTLTHTSATPVLIENNKAGINGGGLHAIGATAVTTVIGGTFRNNTAQQEGGGLWNQSGLMTINGTTITANTANSTNNGANDQGGGGVFNINGRLDIIEATITDNVALMNSGNGGGVMTVGGSLNITGGKIQNNRAAQAGGGIWTRTTGMPVTVTGTDILENRANGTGADQGGGGVFNDSGTLELRDVRLNNNIANSLGGSGGGGFNNAGTLNVFDSEVSGNNLCGLAYLRPSGTLSNLTVNTPNVGGLLCPLLGTSGDDTILVTNTLIMINADQLFYDGTIGPIRIESRLGKDLFNVRSTATSNPITIRSGDGTDTINISSDASGNPGSNVGNLNGILGNINIIGGGSNPNGIGVRSAIASRAPGNNVLLTTQVTLGDSLVIGDRSSVADHSFNWTPTTFARTTTGVSTGVITFAEIESIDVQTGAGNDTVNVTNTTESSFSALRTNEGKDFVSITNIGNSSIMTVHTGTDNDQVAITATGDSSILELVTESGDDSVRLLGRGTKSGTVARMGDGDDSIALGGPTVPPLSTGNDSVIEVHGEDGRDQFVINEVFSRTIMDLRGDNGNDFFTINTAGNDTDGNLIRINNNPAPPLTGATEAIQQLFIDGGANEATTREFVQGITLDANRQATEPGDVPGTGVQLQTGDRIVVNAQLASNLDLRYLIHQPNQGVLATTTPVMPQATPVTTQAARQTVGNEVVDLLNVETIEINTGSGNDILTIYSDIAFDIASSNQAITFNAGAGADRLEVLGTNLSDRITIGAQNDATLEPMEISNIEGIRVNGNDGDDRVSNRSATLSVIDGQLGNDTLLGGSIGDVLTGGGGSDSLFGRNGNDIIFSDRNFGSDQNFLTEEELLDGGNETTARPGDVCVQLGLDLVRNCEVLGDGGAVKDVLTWLRAQIIPVNSISFAEGDPQLEPFNDISQTPVGLLTITEPHVRVPGLLFNPVVPPAQSPLPLPAPAPIVSFPMNVTPAGELIFDVDGDGQVSAIDALRVINLLNQSETALISGDLPAVQVDRSRERADVNGDGMITAVDALMIINRLNANSIAAPVQTSVWSDSVDEIFGVQEDNDLFGKTF